MPAHEAPCVDLGSSPPTPIVATLSPSPSEVSSASSVEPQNVQPTPLFRVLAMPPPEPVQPPGQEELERRLPGYRRIVIPRELTLIELLKQSSGVTTDEEVLHIREAKLQVMAERVGLRRLDVLAPCLRSLTLDGSSISSLRDLGIGMVHLKMLSVNRCKLTSLDGIWGLSSLRELHAARNNLHDLQPLAALQKLHTLNLANNPIADSSRLWMLAVCGALRKLTLEGTPASDEPDYFVNVASALPSLTHLDGRALHSDDEDEFEDLGEPSSSESEAEASPVAPKGKETIPAEPKPSTSKEAFDQGHGDCEDMSSLEACLKVDRSLPKLHRRRPATTENAGNRPRMQLPPRPKTAHERPTIDASTRLEIMNTLMEEEWRCNGSKLTSHGAFCGNLAQALRRPATARKKHIEQAEFDKKIETGIELTERHIALEIPLTPRLDDWARFKQETGIDIDLDFTQRRPPPGDAASAIDRLERIERDTAERLENPKKPVDDFGVQDRNDFVPLNYDIWKMDNTPLMVDDIEIPSIAPVTRTYRPIQEYINEVDDMLRNISLAPEGSLSETPGFHVVNNV